MHRLKAVALAGVAAVTLVFALATVGVASADPRSDYCDVEDLWGGFFVGTLPGNQGFVTFDIFNQQPPDPAHDDGSEDFALASQLALGLGNAGEGDKYHFQWTTVLVSNGATARGHGFLFVMGSTATFVIAGRGEHPLVGRFNLTGEGELACFAEEGTAGMAMFHLRFANGMMDDGTVPTMARCENVETCEGEVG
jgi:hypothetical protein